MATERKPGAQLDFTAAERPRRVQLRGHHVVLRPVIASDDAEPLFAESHPPLADPGLWTYMPGGPYRDAGDLRDALAGRGTVGGSLVLHAGCSSPGSVPPGSPPT